MCIYLYIVLKFMSLLNKKKIFYEINILISYKLQANGKAFCLTVIALKQVLKKINMTFINIEC